MWWDAPTENQYRKTGEIKVHRCKFSNIVYLRTISYSKFMFGGEKERKELPMAWSGSSQKLKANLMWSSVILPFPHGHPTSTVSLLCILTSQTMEL